MEGKRYHLVDAPKRVQDAIPTIRVIGLADDGETIAYVRAERAREILGLLQSTHEFVMGIGEFARGAQAAREEADLGPDLGGSPMELG